ncbi:MAG TPA: tRNA (N6-threonylcarbamoyladenosine(37)-N6)-methyltransferase TrmO [Gammaproteobacteria bacterium]|nr:tRNA (N6-threonylcarbamoyladenosine(37)-N6)-methyltransferase TrmO [Gammaproteobacteria bacterium]
MTDDLTDTTQIEFTPIGIVHSCFDARFGTPRQPGLVPSATAELVLLPPYDHPDSLRGLENCSHVWLLFLFHASAGQGWSPTVRPPRLGGNRRIGVFASRSPFRPNPIGLSVVELAGLIDRPDARGLLLRNHDLVDGTPVLDIKPYIPYSDALPQARPPAGFEQAPPRSPVRFSPAAEADLAAAPADLRSLIEETLALDPRPAYRQRESGRMHGVALAGYNVRWQVVEAEILVERVELLG